MIKLNSFFILMLLTIKLNFVYAQNIVPVSYTHLTLPTSDSSVDLGGRRIIKKKNQFCC